MLVRSAVLLIALVFTRASQAEGLRLRYELTVSPEATHIPVSLEITGISTPSLRLRLTDNYAGIPDYFDKLRDIQVRGARAERPDDWHIVLKPDGRDAVSITYKVALDGRKRERGRTLALVDGVHAFIPGASTFIFPQTSQSIENVSVLFRKPAGWKIATSWGIDRDEYRLGGENLKELIYSFAALGDYRIQTQDFDGIPVHGAFRGAGIATDSEVLDLLVRVLRVHRETFGAIPFRRLLAIGAFVYSDGVTSGNAFHDSINLQMPVDRRLTDHAGFRNLIAHEGFHLWNGGDGILAYADYDVLWFSEGLTEYYAQKNLLRAGLITERDMLEEIAGKYLRLRSSFLRDASMTSAGQRYFDDVRARNLVYTKGALAGFVLDEYLRATTEGRKSLDTVLRTLADRRNNRLRGEQYSHADVRAAVHEVGGSSLERILDRIGGSEYALQFEEVLGMAGFSLTREDQDGFFIGFYDVGPPEEEPAIRALDPEGPAFLAGMQEGDIIRSIAGARVQTRQELDLQVRAITTGTGSEVPVVVDRNGNSLSFIIKPERFYRYILSRT